MEIYLILAFLVIGLLNFSKSESFSEIINSTSNEINSISGENNISTTNSNYTDIQKPTTVSTVDYFTNSSLLEELGLENVTVNADSSNSSSRENTSASVDNDINKIIYKEDNEAVSSGSEQNTQDDASYLHSSNNITKLDPKPKLEWLSKNNTVSTFESKEANDLGLNQNTTDYSSTATDRQETTLSEEEYYSTNADEKKASSVIDTDYDDYTYDETTKKLIRKNWRNMTISKALNGSKLNKTEIKTSNSSRSRDKIKTHSTLTKDDVSYSSEEKKKAIKDATDFSDEKASLIKVSDENHDRKSLNVSSLKKDNDSQIDQVEKNVIDVTEENKNSEIDSQKSIIPKTWIPDSEIKSLLKETLDRLSSVSITSPINTDYHTYAPKKATELETDTVTQKEITVKIEDKNKGTTTVNPSRNLETILKKDQQWDSFLSKNAEEIKEFDKLEYNTKNVSYSPITKLKNISITTMNTNSSQVGKLLKTMNADYRKFADDSIAIKSTTKVETSPVKNDTWNSSQTEKYPKKTKIDKHVNITKSFIRNKKCPYAKAVENFDINKLNGYLQTVYYTMQERITCFKIFMIKISEEEKKQYRNIYGDFQGRINWTRCDFEIKTGTKLKRKHFLQNTGFPDGVYENKILVIDSDSAGGLDLLPTLIDEDPDQWTPVNNLVFMRDCKSGRVLIFKRNPREKVSLKELKEALLAAGEGFNGRLSCRKKDRSRSDSF